MIATARQRLNALGIPSIYAVLLLFYLVAAVLVALFGRGTFISGANISNLAVRSVALGIVAVGQTFAILAGSLDLSVAYLISVVAVMSSYTMQGDPDRVPRAVALVLAIGAGVGLANGLIITKLRLNAFIATLGTGLLMQGVLNASFDNFAGSVPSSFEQLGYGKWFGVPISVVMLLAVAGVGSFILRRTRFGAHIYAVGGNRETARLSGVRTDRVIIGAHIVCSLTAALSGLFIVSRLRAGAPWVGPDGVYDLESIAAVVVGGTALSGGRGGVWGTLGGVFIFSVLDMMFNQLGIDPFLKQVLRGLIIIAAVASYSVRSREAAA
jgi:ribose transport system permease protein